jgi:hypothetical protein
MPAPRPAPAPAPAPEDGRKGGPAPGRTDDDVPGLPPMDGQDDEREAEAPPLDEALHPNDDGGDPFDDATGEGDVLPDLAEDGAEGGWLGDTEAAEGLDVGAADLIGSEEDDLLSDNDDADVPMDDFDLAREESRVALDGGEEGPVTDDDTLDEGGLPRLEADDDGAMDDPGSFFDEDLGEKTPGTWSTPWERLGAPLSVAPTRALARSPRGVVAAGRELVRIDLEGTVEPLLAHGLEGSEVTGLHGLHRAGQDVFVTTEAGSLFVSRDEGATFAEAAGWRIHVRPEEAAAGLDVVVAIDALWGRTGQGMLLRSADGGESWAVADVDGFVRALSTDSAGRCVILVRALRASEVLRLRSGAEEWDRTPLPLDLVPAELTGRASIVAGDGTVAVALEGVGVFRALEGAGWSRIAGTEAVTAVALLDDAGTMVVAVAGADGGERQSSLLRVGADGDPKVVAVWDDRPEGDAGAVAIAVDEAHQVVWVGGGFGVMAFQPRMR